MKHKIILTILFLLINTTTTVNAISMDSTGFRIESAGIHDAAGNKSSNSYRLSDTVGQLAAGQFSSNGYIVKAGFQYLRSIIPFAFSISNTIISLGTITPNTPATDSTTLTVSFGGAGQYQVTVTELGPMTKLGTVATIPDTVCDGGGNTCSETLAKVWSSSSAYGFGYNMTGQDIPVDFIDSTYYRPFADQTAAESSAIVMSSSDVGRSRQSTLTFKLNVSPIQTSGTYQTIINFVATPSY